VTRLESYAPELVVVGGGMGGISCAMRARHLGARVALIEPEALGGT
jgi:glutathione reductase (NADPH)